ncbi:hypothetical protein C7212DRAFT_364969 [Tuber magnatum]|uniref:Sucraseferredoxin-like protein n=1 Tax=Tuber magnatum TaxID=42249 RepID=A0A317SJ95_9PEZI|nr:hypothetical protein C7212DRAFT_364969 [Tuber magnatum]
MSLGALIRRGTSFFNNGKSVGTATKDTLFPVVSKDVDGEDCDHDCDHCPGYGRAFDKIGVETKEELWGGIKGFANHVVVATGETDWVRDVGDIKGSVMRELNNNSEMLEQGRLMVSASNLQPPLEYHSAAEEGKPQPTTVIVLPSFTVVENVTPSETPELIRRFINTGPTTSTPLDPPPLTPKSPLSPATPPTPLARPFPFPSRAGPESEKEPELVQVEAPSPTAKPSLEATSAPAVEGGDAVTESSPLDDSFTTLSLAPSSALKSHPFPHAYLILICSHRRRDARCGISAPILHKEFEKHLRPLNLWRDITDTRDGGAKVLFINHVGGHKYSANVIIYRKEDGQGIWLARVAPKHIEGIVKFTVLQGKVVHPDMIRGGFNRRVGGISW